ncbi:MAG TPA: tetratricopeptide repeat protein [Rhodospirillaceae bacterium]|nr:tetratricopeptide repeat protein [Rhodospirillaceae bacterium]
MTPVPPRRRRRAAKSIGVARSNSKPAAVNADDLARLRGLLTAEPASPRWLFHIAWLLVSRHRLDEALAWSRRLLAVDGTHAQILAPMSHALCGLGMMTEAIAAIRRCLVFIPADPGVLSCLLYALQATGRLTEAVVPGQRSLLLNPQHLDTLSNLSAVLCSLKRVDEGMACLRQALRIHPEHPGSLMNLASFYYQKGDLAASAGLCRRVLAQTPADAGAYANQGTATLDQGRSRDAILLYRRAVTLAPANADANMYAGMAYLRLGGFGTGWDLYDWRLRGGTAVSPQPRFRQPQWDGGEIDGKTILLHYEQGLGDTLQFSRYAPLVARQAKVVLAVQRPLVKLLRTLPGNIEVIGEGDPLPPFDLHCPLLSLPRLFRTTARDIPAAGAYLAADPGRLADWTARIAGRRPRIGLAWSGNPQHVADHRRTVPLSKLLPLIWNSGADWHAVQKDLRPEDRRLVAATPNLTWHGDRLADFQDTAALISALDLVISVDTSVAHLAGALGRPTWLMLPYAPDWRWLEERDDSPWYACFRLFRQARIGDWDEVIAQLAAHLAAFSRPASPDDSWDS